ncbi:MAG: FIST signal transduction protein, partial [Persicimonas sp.]
VEGINAELGSEVWVTGGLAGDGDRFERTWVLDDGRPADNVVTAVGFYGDALRFSHGSKGGWDHFGPQREVTRSRGSVLYELDGQPALKLYKRYLGEQADDLPASGLLYPLAIHAEEGDERLVRTILAVDEDDQSLTFAGDVPQGARVQLMKANFHRLVEGAAGAADACVSMSEHLGDVLAVAISCVGRRLILKERIEDELQAVDEVLPEGAQMVGFYSYGELSPYVEGADCALHNQTMTLTVLSEA